MGFVGKQRSITKETTLRSCGIPASGASGSSAFGDSPEDFSLKTSFMRSRWTCVGEPGNSLNLHKKCTATSFNFFEGKKHSHSLAQKKHRHFYSATSTVPNNSASTSLARK
eukprot:GHVP01034398.1.p1 GENE.GHVP01034398.1~~GHVP01034398.1.p1  ORF type:complete len:111 (-),score=5.39 GHVP01034398.1:201-533(-)